MYKSTFLVEDLNKLFNTYFEINIKFAVDTNLDGYFVYRDDIYYFKNSYLDYPIFLELLSKFNKMICKKKLERFLIFVSKELGDDVFIDYSRILEKNK